MKYKAAIFDMDGTLIDSTWVWCELYKEFTKKFKLEKDFKMEHTMHMPPTECCSKLKSAYNLTQTVDELKNMFYNNAIEFYSKRVDLKPGVGELLKLMRQKGILICLATSNFAGISEIILKKHGLYDYFCDFSFSDSYGVNKKTAILYLKCAEKINISPQECAIFEDILDPLDDAKKHKMGYFGVDDDYQSTEIKETLKLKSDCFITNYFNFIEQRYDDFF